MDEVFKILLFLKRTDFLRRKFEMHNVTRIHLHIFCIYFGVFRFKLFPHFYTCFKFACFVLFFYRLFGGSAGQRSFENVYTGLIIHLTDFTDNINSEITVYNCIQKFFLKKKPYFCTLRYKNK